MRTVVVCQIQYEVIIFFSVFMMFLSDFASAKDIQLDKNSEEKALQIKDWFALGSGCKGRPGGVGDVRMKMLKSKDPLNYQVTFSKGSYELNSFKSLSRKPSFARECALRIAAYPPPGFRIAYVQAWGSILLSKDKGAAAQVKAQLITAMGNLGKQSFEFSKNLRVLDRKINLVLKPDIDGKQLLKEIPCDKPKIIGIDFQFVNQKESFVPKVKIRPDQKDLATMQITLEKCQLDQAVQA